MSNPYRPGDSLAPFAGRQLELARIDHYLKDPAAVDALTFLGWHWLGKTALLRRFDSVFHDHAVGVFLGLKTLDLDSENTFIQAIMDATGQALVERDITINRLPSPDLEMPVLRVWFAETWLPGVLHVLRAHRKLVLLIDDAHLWLDAEAGDGWPGATFDFFSDLLHQHSQLKMVLTFAAEREEAISQMRPLVQPSNLLRLTHLPAEAAAWLLQYTGQYAVTEDAAAAVYRATGGHPQLLQRFAHHLYQYHETHPDVVRTTPELVRTLLPGVYHASAEELTGLWAASTDTEQLVLLAICRLRYDDPLQSITPDSISEWLINGDYPLDRTAVNAALRSLEYRELIAHRLPGIELTCSLLQTWLLESTRHAAVAEKTGGSRLRTPVIVAVLVVIALAALLLIALSNTPQPAATVTPRVAPTVTLVGGG